MVLLHAGPWSPQEDAQLTELVKQYGGKHWARIASLLPGRTGKQCRERWCNNLDPSLKKGAWSAEVRTPLAIIRLRGELSPPLCAPPIYPYAVSAAVAWVRRLYGRRD